MPVVLPRREASEVIEPPDIPALGPPVRQALHGLVTQIERDALLGHLAIANGGVAKLVDDEILGEGGQRLFVALQGGITNNAATPQLLAQGDADTIARAPCWSRS